MDKVASGFILRIPLGLPVQQEYGRYGRFYGRSDPSESDMSIRIHVPARKGKNPENIEVFEVFYLCDMVAGVGFEPTAFRL